VYKGKKFNAAKVQGHSVLSSNARTLTPWQETVLGESYLGLHIFRFYIRCPRCSNEIAFKVFVCVCVCFGGGGGGGGGVCMCAYRLRLLYSAALRLFLSFARVVFSRVLLMLTAFR
jgi:hypothetical protein